VGRHGGRSDEKITDLGYENDVHLSPADPAAAWWENQPAGADRQGRAAEPWWDDAPVPPPVVVASADGRTPAVTFPPGADPFSAGGVFAPTGAREGEPSVVLHAAPDAAVARSARRRGAGACDTAALRLLDPGPGTGSLVRPYVSAVEPVAQPVAEPVDQPVDQPVAQPAAAGAATPAPARPVPAVLDAFLSRRRPGRSGGPLELIVEPAASGGVPVAARPVGEWSAPWAAEAAPEMPRSLFEPRTRAANPAGAWATPSEQALPSRRALRAQERTGQAPRPVGKARAAAERASTVQLGSPSAGYTLAGSELAHRTAGRRLAKSGVLAVTALGVVAASAPNAFSALGWHLPSHPGDSSAQAAIVGLAGAGALPATGVSLSSPADAGDALDLALTKVVAQRRAVDGVAAAEAAARAGAVATGTGRTLVDVARDQVRAEVARKAAIAERASRNVVRDPRAYARLLLSQRGWGEAQFSCLNLLWNRESGWNYQAYNPSSGAYGIPQALPGSKMASIAADWRTNPGTQIRWGLNYIADRYATPCGAWGHSEATGWY
jgi:hypothetical protein